MEKSNLEIRVERIEKVIDDIQRDVKAMDTRMSEMDKSISARMDRMDKSISVRMARMEALMENVGHRIVSHRVVSAERKAEKTGNWPWLIMIGVIVASGIPALITKILS